MSKKRCYVIAWAFFICYLLFANRIILYFDKDAKAERVDLSDYYGDATVHYYIDTYEKRGGLLEKYYIQGWAYCETEQDNQGKTISILLKNTKNDSCYKIENKAQYRIDVYEAFKKEKKIYNAMNGLESCFSTIGISEGEYQLYLYVEENKTDYGVTATNLFYVKDKNEFVFVGVK
ncbi:MAG: hypothetical protein K2N87_18830 [Eubacterium sp.]|nr:hypothetical protein [Eubacterium sp.]